MTERRDSLHFETDVLVIGAGGAGLYAALAAAGEGARVLLVDRNLIGRGGATVMAQMTVAAALAEEAPDHWEHHLADTLAAGRGLCDRELAALVCRDAPGRMREMDAWGVGWARADGHIRQVTAPGHDRPRCCYVDFLDTGPAVAGTLRKRAGKTPGIRRVSNLSITDLVVPDGVCHGAIGVALDDGRDASIDAHATIIATGGLTKLYARTSASDNMAGEGYALALRAGAQLVDMEFVQFFPIGHLAPRLVGMDPIMWDPFRYKLGGRLLNGAGEEFVERYGGEDGGRYTATRDLATYAICSEVAAGRGTPAGGAFLSFAHVPEADLRAAFGPVIDRLLANGIDLSAAPVEVAPIAHYHMGGIAVDVDLRTGVDGLYAAGEAVGGASGANRLSGNAISEALVFGARAGRGAAAHRATAGGFSRAAAQRLRDAASDEAGKGDAVSAAALFGELKDLMWKDVGPFRTGESLERALTDIERIDATFRDLAIPPVEPFANARLDWYELRAALLVARSVTVAARERRESRGAHQRLDYPDTGPAFEYRQTITLRDGKVHCARAGGPVT